MLSGTEAWQILPWILMRKGPSYSEHPSSSPARTTGTRFLFLILITMFSGRLVAGNSRVPFSTKKAKQGRKWYNPSMQFSATRIHFKGKLETAKKKKSELHVLRKSIADMISSDWALVKLNGMSGCNLQEEPVLLIKGRYCDFNNWKGKDQVL